MIQPTGQTPRQRQTISHIKLIAKLLTVLWLSIGHGTGRISAAPPVTALTLTPDGTQYVIGSQAGVSVHDLQLGNRLSQLQTQLVQVHDLKFSPDGSQLLAAGGSPSESGRVERWSWPAAQRIETLGNFTEVIYRASWSSDGRKIAVAVGDGTCHVFEGAEAVQKTYTGHSRGVLGICFGSGDEKILSAGRDQTIQLWSSRTLKRERGLNNHTDTVNDLAMQAQTSARAARPLLVSVSDDRSVRLWQPDIGRLVRFARLDSVPRCVRWIDRDEAGDLLLVGSDDGKVIVLKADDMVIDQTLHCDIRPIFELALTADRRQVLVGGEGGVQSLALP